MPRFSAASFDAAYPFGQVNLSDDVLPISVKIKGFNPLIPGDVAASSTPSGHPQIRSNDSTNVTPGRSGMWRMRNFIGIDGSKQSKNWKGDLVYLGAKNNQNEYRESSALKGIFMSSQGVDNQDPAWGTIALSTAERELVSFRRSSTPNDWENSILDFWDDFSADGVLSDKDKLVDDNPMASLAVKKNNSGTQQSNLYFLHQLAFPQSPRLEQCPVFRLSWQNHW